jgi:hypothetical protein
VTQRPFSADLQRQFRDTLRTPGSPEIIDDQNEVIPVAIIAGQNLGIPRVSVNQTLRRAIYYQAPAAAARTVQVATPSSSTRLYFYGIQFYGLDTAANRIFRVFDASTGTWTAADGTNTIFYQGGFTTNVLGHGASFPPFPVESTNGIRLSLDAVSAGSEMLITVYFVEEAVL